MERWELGGVDGRSNSAGASYGQAVEAALVLFVALLCDCCARYALVRYLKAK